MRKKTDPDAPDRTYPCDGCGGEYPASYLSEFVIDAGTPTEDWIDVCDRCGEARPIGATSPNVPIWRGGH